MKGKQARLLWWGCSGDHAGILDVLAVRAAKTTQVLFRKAMKKHAQRFPDCQAKAFHIAKSQAALLQENTRMTVRIISPEEAEALKAEAQKPGRVELVPVPKKLGIMDRLDRWMQRKFPRYRTT